MKRDYSTLTALLMTLLFALMIIPAIVGGGRAYEAISESSREAFDSRTAVGYIATQLRNCEDKGQVYIDSFCGDTLNIPSTVEGEKYLTKIYVYEGMLCELFASPDSGLFPEDGQSLIPLEDLTAELSDGLLTLNLGGREIFMEVGE